jgi:hypothetical protein
MHEGVRERLLAYADELEGWVSGNRPVPPGGLSTGLRLALLACSAWFRAKASRTAPLQPAGVVNESTPSHVAVHAGHREQQACLAMMARGPAPRAELGDPLP